MARRANTNLNEQHILYLCENFFSEELPYVLGSNGMEGDIDRYTYALLTLAHAEGATKLYFIAEIILGNQILKLLYYLTRTLDVAGASNTNRNFKHNILPHNIYFVLG